MGMIPACLLYQYLGPKKLYGEWIPSLSSLLDSFLFLKHAPWWWGCSINMVAPNKENDNLAMDPWCNSTTLTEPDGTSWNKLCNCSLVVLWVVGWKEPILHVNAQLKPPKAYKAITMFFSRNTAESRSAEKRRFQRKFLWPHLGKVPCRPTVSRGVLQICGKQIKNDWLIEMSLSYSMMTALGSHLISCRFSHRTWATLLVHEP